VTRPAAPAERSALRTGLLPRSAADDSAVVSRLTELVNSVYSVAEKGLWADGANRTCAADIADFTRAGEIAVAARRERPLGCVRIRQLDDNVSEFGMLAVGPSHRGAGIGRELVRFAEQRGRDMGCATMQLELLVPLDWNHPSKESLAQWYGRMGYTADSTGSPAELYPGLAPLLVTPCELIIYRKNIGDRL
jgi:GNAT superfamily N-acetyltransferase